LASQLTESWPDPRIKLFTIWRLLRLRREQRELFQFGTYLPLEVRGRYAEHVVAFARVHGSNLLLVAVPRLTQRLRSAQAKKASGPGWRHDWDDTEIVLLSDAPASLANLFTAQPFDVLRNEQSETTLRVQSLLQSFPVAALTNVSFS
jgi:(1->4)-alpha-D-glucan 1-alpha-D-glucosylmutase